MKRRLFSGLLLGLLTVSAFGKSKLEGVWQTVEVKGQIGSNEETNDREPGLLIFTEKYYSVLAALSDARTQVPDQAKATAAELLAIWGPFIANSGTYEISGDTVALTAMVAKNPGAVKAGSPIKLSFQLEGDTLTTTTSIPTTSGNGRQKITMTLHRLE